MSPLADQVRYSNLGEGVAYRRNSLCKGKKKMMIHSFYDAVRAFACMQSNNSHVIFPLSSRVLRAIRPVTSSAPHFDYISKTFYLCASPTLPHFSPFHGTILTWSFLQAHHSNSDLILPKHADAAERAKRGKLIFSHKGSWSSNHTRTS